jgi:tRNA (guanine-N7-)-methyltransferase
LVRAAFLGAYRAINVGYDRREAMPENFQSKGRRAYFGRRKGHKLRPGRAELFSTLLPQLALDLSAAAPRDLRLLFPRPVGEIVLEIGFGAGEHFVREAAARPDVGFIGCEPFVNGMAGALAAIQAAKLDNVRLHHGDAIEILDWLPDASIARVDVLFPDPWPKRRHWKRRLISDDTIARLARVVTSDGLLRFATDIPDYAEWTLLRVSRSGTFLWTAEHAEDWRAPWVDHVSTRYELKALEAGRRPIYFVFRRR